MGENERESSGDTASGRQPLQYGSWPSFVTDGHQGDDDIRDRLSRIEGAVFEILENQRLRDRDVRRRSRAA